MTQLITRKYENEGLKLSFTESIDIKIIYEIYSDCVWTILIWIVERKDGVKWTGLIWLRIGTSGGLI
jgi:hypothetical protein